MGATIYSSACILNNAFGSISFTPPANYYIGLSTTTITSSGSTATEPVGYNYSRVEIPNDKSNFSYLVSGSILNNNLIEFSESSGSWGTIVDVALWDASTNGNVWYFQELSSPKIVQSNTTVSFSGSALKFSMAST